MVAERAGMVLLFAGDVPLLGLLLDLLADVGHRVFRVADVEEGFDLAARDRPDVILLDVGFPPDAQADILSRLKREHATAAIPVIALTDETASLGEAGGLLDGWIGKPFDIDVLEEHVARAVGRPTMRSSTRSQTKAS
jgi:DNA-binding response OmpR family regulator